MTKVINCTPHTINMFSDGKNIAFPASGINPRVGVVETPADSIMEFACITQKSGEVEGLPEMEDSVFLIVSGMVFAASDRQDLIAPDTGKTAIRNAAGQIEAVTRFIRK